jgi:type III pantothenate kinase
MVVGSATPMNAMLALDAGNTRIKWGLHDGRGWVAQGAAPTAEAEQIARALGTATRASAAIASNVAGSKVEAQLRRICAEAKIALRVIRSEAQQLGVINGYREPRQLGSDRWAALVAAHAAQQGHKLVVNAGTALTIDALSAEGQFLGGLIVPGPALMRRSLDRGTAGLRLTEGDFAAFPASTPEAITSGAVQAAVGAIERMGALMAARGLSPVRVLLSGGAAGELAAHLPLAHAMHENLVLDGLILIARNS